MPVDGGICVAWSEESSAVFEFEEEDAEEVVPVCGDENLDAGEECDDGNQVDGDRCSAECTIEESGCSNLAGVVAVTVVVPYDLSGHAPFIKIPDRLELAIELNDTVAVTESEPFVDVTGATVGGSMTGSSTGSVAGYPDLAGKSTCDCTESNCAYRMGTNGELSGGEEIIYGLNIF